MTDGDTEEEDADMLQAIQAIDYHELFDDGQDVHAEQEQDGQQDVAPAQIPPENEDPGQAQEERIQSTWKRRLATRPKKARDEHDAQGQRRLQQAQEPGAQHEAAERSAVRCRLRQHPERRGQRY